MIDNVTLTFLPKTREDFVLYNSILAQFKYKRKHVFVSLTSNIKLCIYTQQKFLQIKVFHLNDFLKVKDITTGDYINFETKFNDSIKHFNLSLDNLRLTRIDYKLDLRLPEIEMKEYLYVFSKLRQSYYSLKKKVYWNHDKSKVESVYYKGNRFNINVYDKQNQLSKKGIHDPIYENVLRIEVQVKTRELTDYCKLYGTTKELINFWHSDVRNVFFNDLLIGKFLYTGDYYDLQNINQILSSIKPSTHQRIIKFCEYIAETDITEAVNTYSRGTALKYIKELTNKNINPVPIKSMSRLLGIKSILEEKAI